MAHIEVVAAFLIGALLSKLASDASNLLFPKDDVRDVDVRNQPSQPSYRIDGVNVEKKNVPKVYEAWNSYSSKR